MKKEFDLGCFGIIAIIVLGLLTVYAIIYNNFTQAIYCLLIVWFMFYLAEEKK